MVVRWSKCWRIGVLSIGAINGIRYVLDKNTANAIMKEALTQASEIKLRRRQKKIPLQAKSNMLTKANILLPELMEIAIL